MSDILTKFREYLDSEEGKEKERLYFERLNKEIEIKNSQYDRFHSRIKSSEDFSNFVEKVITKYESDIYKDKEYKAGREPREPLYFFLLEYAEKYGRECTKEEFDKYGNDFTNDLFIVHNYYFNLMNGQGSVVLIGKIV